MKRLLKAASFLTILIASTQSWSYQLPGQFLLEAGGFYSTQGKNQIIYIDGLIGDEFTVNDRHDKNFLVGGAWMINAYKTCQYGIDYGINAFYFAKSTVKGNIVQELLFENLAYKYDVTHIPVYLFAKGYMNMNYYLTGITVDAGIGPNFMKTDMSGDSSLDGITLPDDAFIGSTSNTVFSAMAGIGVKFCLSQVPMEIGYRYFYLGEGEFKRRKPAIINKLKTGNITAQALMLTIYL